MNAAEPGLLGRIERPGSVVLVRASRIGDFVCATPAFRALRAALPGAKITLVGLPLVRELAKRSPHLDGFVPFPGFPGMAEQFFDPRNAVNFFGLMQDERFDLAIQMHGSGAYSNTFTLLLGARHTAGFIRPGDESGLLDAALPRPEGHEIERTLALTSFLGAPSCGVDSEFPLLPEDRRRGVALVANCSRPRIGIHMGAADAAKRWPPEHFAAAAAAIQRVAGGGIILLGNAAERAPAAAIAPTLSSCLDLTGRTTLPDLGAVIERLDLLLTTDSGPAHIAYALGVPTVTLFVNTDPAEWGPRDTVPRCVLLPPAGDVSRSITVEETVRAVIAVLNAGPLRAAPPGSGSPAPPTRD
jgi:ADP-heptose:LPS heptosyltransferase